MCRKITSNKKGFNCKRVYIFPTTTVSYLRKISKRTSPTAPSIKNDSNLPSTGTLKNTPHDTRKKMEPCLHGFIPYLLLLNHIPKNKKKHTTGKTSNTLRLLLPVSGGPQLYLFQHPQAPSLANHFILQLAHRTVCRHRRLLAFQIVCQPRARPVYHQA